MTKLQIDAPDGPARRQLLAGAVRLAMALGAVYHDMRGHLLADEREVLAALARDHSVTSSRNA